MTCKTPYELGNIIRMIRHTDSGIRRQAEAYLNTLVKPAGSLGKLESLAVQLASITGKVRDFRLDKRCIIVMCADNGITEEGVCSAPQNVTQLMAKTMACGGSAVTVMAKEADADVRLVDVGINGEIDAPGIVPQKVMSGTRNFAKGAAMTRAECMQALEIGIRTVCELTDCGYVLFGTGELGMGNTSSSAAVLSALCGVPVEQVTGRGAGLSDEAYLHKKKILKQALEVNHPNASDPIDVISKVGGLDIAGLVGVYLGAAFRRCPVVIDGFISAVSALAAVRLCPAAADYMIPSHCSAEPGCSFVLRELGMDPLLTMNMRLGEGTGCPLAFRILDQAVAVMNHMMTFREAFIDTSLFGKISSEKTDA